MRAVTRKNLTILFDKMNENLLEAKKPHVKIDSDPEPAKGSQVWIYSQTQNIRSLQL